MSRVGWDHRIIDDRIEKSIKGRWIGHNLCKHVCSGSCTGPAAPTDHICTPCRASLGEWGWSEGAPGQYLPGTPPPWLHSAKTFFIAAILLRENDDIGIILFYYVIYNSVGGMKYALLRILTAGHKGGSIKHCFISLVTQDFSLLIHFVLCSLTLKGVCHKIFDLQFFS